MAINSDPITLHKDSKILKGTIQLDGSKSISNRLLIIQALCEDEFEIKHLSTSDDTSVLKNALKEGPETIDIGHAGTSMRFSTAFFALNSDTQIITGSNRMKERPIGPLVDALNSLGANITYVEKEGYPPLKVGSFTNKNVDEIKINAGISSQFITAILLIAPYLKNGLTIHLEGSLVSRSYIHLTIEIMRYYGIEIQWNENAITISPGKYSAKASTVESDWSAASYYYVMAAFANEVDLELTGLQEDSFQGDAAIKTIMESFGIKTSPTDQGIRLQKTENSIPFLEYDFITCPDIAQSIFVLCGGLGVNGLFSGLQTLSIKETDRIKAMQTELAKLQVYLSKLPERFSKSDMDFYMQDGKASFSEGVEFDTYKDHRMAMSLACLAMLFPVTIKEKNVVSKSYGNFWKDLESLGFSLS